MKKIVQEENKSYAMITGEDIPILYVLGNMPEVLRKQLDQTLQNRSVDVFYQDRELQDKVLTFTDQESVDYIKKEQALLDEDQYQDKTDEYVQGCIDATCKNFKLYQEQKGNDQNKFDLLGHLYYHEITSLNNHLSRRQAMRTQSKTY